MRIVRWVLFALGFLIGSAFGSAVRSETPAEDLSVLPPPSVSDDPHDLSGWVGTGALQRLHPTALTSVDASDGGGDEESWCSCDTARRWVRESDQEFDCFISPITNPVFFEDPRTLTEARVIFLHQTAPTRAPLNGGEFQYLGAQARVALSERLSAVMTKGGFFFGGDPAPVDDGWSDVALGLKYNLFREPDAQQLVSVGLNYELPVGSPAALQGNGGGEYYLYMTGGAAVFDYSHLLSTLGWRMPGSPDAESQLLQWSNHWDTRIWSGGLYVLAEANWYHYLNSGNNAPLDVEGLDLFNLGSTDVAGHDIVTGAAGLKLKRSPHRELGVAYELPLTDRRDFLTDRVTVDMILRF